MEKSNPFPVTSYPGPRYFCDREEQLALLKSNCLNGLHTLLLSVRRMGKTGLIRQLFHTLPKRKVVAMYLDIHPTTHLGEFASELGTAIARAYPRQKSAGKKFLDLLGRLRPVIAFDPLTGSPEVSFDFSQEKETISTISALLEFLGGQKERIVVAIDEFQQVLNYPEKNTEALLRKHLQQLPNVSFIFSGSSRHLLTDMFSDVRRPFFSSAQPMHLQEIPEDRYAAFISQHFTTAGRRIEEDALEYVLRYTRRHTYYTQVVCNRLYGSGLKKIVLEDVMKTCRQLLLEQEYIFFQYRQLLTPNQWSLLVAIGKEGRLRHPNRKDFLRKHNLGQPSSVQRALVSLLDNEMIYASEDETGNYYTVYDTFLARWLEDY